MNNKNLPADGDPQNGRVAGWIVIGAFLGVCCLLSSLIVLCEKYGLGIW